MSAGPKHEIVIIRRGNHGDHDEHHGGVWKIAFADFMTAMMAFFLVMWLISANDKTRASVARYFNPVRLVDATTQPRGLHDSKKDDSGITASPDTKQSEGKSKEMTKDAPGAKPDVQSRNETSGAREKRLDAALRDNPIAALAEIVAEQGAGDNQPKNASRIATPVIGRNGGAAFRDPFAPLPQLIGENSKEVSPVDATPENNAATTMKVTNSATDTTPTAKTKLSGTKSSENVKAEAKAADLAGQLMSSLNFGGRPGPDLNVRATKEGLLVSLTDTGNFSMFAKGSAVPSKRVILMMESLAKILTTKPGAVVIRGFTDNKQFRAGRYDNWHLSLDRAQTAHYMLVRGGLPDARIVSVDGLADRAARPGADPSSPLNRRIEILLRNDAK